MSDATPKKGDIAVCSLGRTGVITDCDAREVNYGDGNKGVAWVGKTISPEEFFGRPWSSRNPRIIGHISDLTTIEDLRQSSSET